MRISTGIRKTRLIPVSVFILLAVGCGSSSYYQPPGALEEFAILSVGGVEFGKSLYVTSIDGKLTDKYGRNFNIPDSLHDDLRSEGLIEPDRAVLIAVGEHEVVLRASEASWNPLCLYGKWAEVTLVLPAVSDGRYVPRAEVDKESDYATFWIEDARTNQKAVNAVKTLELNCLKTP